MPVVPGVSLLLRGAKLAGGDRPVDVLLKHGTVTGVGRDERGDALTGTTELDLAGRYLVPGLWDEHVHFDQLALTSSRVDVSAATSAAHVAGLMRDAPRPDTGLPHVGFGFRDGLWPDTASAALLELPGDVPVVVISGDIHSCWLNVASAKRFGVPIDSSGMLREDDAFAIITAVQQVPDDVLDAWVLGCAEAAASRGVVGVVDFEMGESLERWQRRFADGFRTIRVDAAVYQPQLDAAIDRAHYTNEVLDGSDGRLRVGPFKIITDGSLNTRTALCSHPYPGVGGAGAHGQQLVKEAELEAIMRRASSAGFTPAVHAIGDAANHYALDAFERVGCVGRIEHAQLLERADIGRFGELGVTASMQPEQAMDDRDVADKFWSGRTDRAFALRSLLDHGATIALGSDAPVAPLDPWITAAAAVGRSRGGREPWCPDQRISPAEAFMASTRGRAGISVGDAADLVVVERDPLAAPHESIRTMSVAATMVAGYLTFDGLS